MRGDFLYINIFRGSLGRSRCQDSSITHNHKVQQTSVTTLKELTQWVINYP